MILIKELKYFIRDRVNLFFLVAFPAILIYLLGNMLEQIDVAEYPIGTIMVEYRLENMNSVQRQSIDLFLKNLNDGKSMVFTENNLVENSKKKIGEGKITALIIFHQNEIEIYEGKEDIKNRTVYALMNGFVQSKKAIQAIRTVKPMNLNTVQVNQSFVQEKEYNMNRTMLDYYGISMIIMMVCIGIIAGASDWMGERQNKTINRLFLSPISRKSIFIQKILGLLPQTALQISILMIICVVFFKVNYASTILGNILLFLYLFFSMIAFTSVGVLFGLFVKVNPSVLFMPIIWVMLFVSGTFARPIYIEGVSNRMPAYILQQAAFDLTIFGKIDRIIQVMLIEAIVIAAVIIIGSFAVERMGEER